MNDTVLIYSGGLDSTVLLYELLFQRKAKVHCLSIDYGQRHVLELRAARRITEALGVEHRIADLTNIKFLLGSSSQTNALIPVPEGNYDDESMKVTVVPNRNAIMLSIAIGWAITLKARYVAYAAHAGDHAIYPDCRAEFADLIDQMAQTCDWHRVELFRPYINLTKADIVGIGRDLNVPFEQTWSCYKGVGKHCGKCGTCRERIEAFQLAGIIDRTEYQS